jgi:hypothetical protein
MRKGGSFGFDQNKCFKPIYFAKPSGFDLEVRKMALIAKSKTSGA